MLSELPKRKRLRLPNYDYSQAGYYFVTVCVKDKRSLLGEFVGRDDSGAPQIALSRYGSLTEKYLLSINNAYDNICVDKYVIMPNHIHFILCLEPEENGAPESSRPTNRVSSVVGCFKRFTNRDTGKKLWQTSLHEHIIRNEEDYLRIWQYIDGNPAKWTEDRYYTE